jgi:hypothetical protein
MDLSRGLGDVYKRQPMTFIEGQDVDVPTYIRKAVRLPAG